MIRIAIAAALLRTTGATVEYRVQRQKKQTNRDGTTVMAVKSLRSARRKYKAMRIADTDTITIRVVATVAQRHGTVEGETNV